MTLALLLSCSLLLHIVVTQIRGHIHTAVLYNSRILSLFPNAVRALHFYREKTSARSSLVDSRRIVPIPTLLYNNRLALSTAEQQSLQFENKKLHTTRVHNTCMPGTYGDSNP